MNRVDIADRLEAHAHRILSASMQARWDQAEVFVKVATVTRCVLDEGGSIETHTGEETGIALRVWSREGSMGFVHADGALDRSPDRLVGLVEPSRSGAPGNLISRLPSCGSPPEKSSIPSRSSQAPERSGHDGDPPGAPAVESFLHNIQDRFSLMRGDRPARLRAQIASGRIETIILNCLGGRARFQQTVTSAGLELMSSEAARIRQCSSRFGFPPATSSLSESPSRSAFGAGSSVRYEKLAAGLGDLDPVLMVEEACWRAAVSSGTFVVPVRTVPVILSPHCAAQWIRTLLPRFVGREGLSSPRGSGLTRVPGVTIVDDPGGSWHAPSTSGPVQPIDGEGRRARPRVLMRDGVLEEVILDSRDPVASEKDLGPMRRDSYRELPSPGPLRLILLPGQPTPDGLIEMMGSGLLVTQLTPLSTEGSDQLLAEIRGLWLEGGKDPAPIGSTFARLPGWEEIGRLKAWGADVELDHSGIPVGCPSLLLEGIEVTPS